jgi:asparagine synthase (glutamine-hydrolysing)
VEALADVLPADVRTKEKTGWFSPMAKWLRQPDVRAEVKSRLAALPKEIVDPAEAVRLLDAHVAKEGYHLQPIWNLVALQAWCSAFGVKA